ncbi:Teneurin-3 [Actinoplanes sp. SE50]|uniref:RHS repeat-associated core domain-containing protein n=1 Tax=Actinoplanes sp. SE50 TaxID=2033844 RepID=UPI000C059F99|nr:RHS repeat-associated core domain-containing protein [Actinoplanes sp. SE50]ATO85126.1 Teneurin-3 [Actinoplanes sp. SE50]
MVIWGFRGKHGFGSAFIYLIIVALLAPSAVIVDALPATARAVGSGADFVYDELGRLVTVVRGAGGADGVARYEYDTAGNITAVRRENPTTAGVIDFDPRLGRAGTDVTILGRGFAATAAQNSVQFGSAPAAVLSASTTRLVVRVPSDGTSGPIRVATPTGAYTSAQPFRFPPPGPAVTGISPVTVAAGSTVRIEGGNFSPRLAENAVDFNGQLGEVVAATASTLTVRAPAGVTSGPIGVSTPFGQTRSSGYAYVPPSSFGVADVDFTTSLATGAATTVRVSKPEKIAMVVLAGYAGQRVTLRATGITIDSGVLTVLKPDGEELDYWTFSSGGELFTDTLTLPMAGTYTIVVDPRDQHTGTLQVALAAVPADDTAAVTVGGPASTVRITAAGQNGRRTFPGSVGQRVTLRATGITIDSGVLTVLKPDGEELDYWTFSSGNELTPDPLTLPTAGTYTIVVDPRDQHTGTLQVALTAASGGARPAERPRLAAPTTSLTGRVARLNGAGLAKVTLRVGNRAAVADPAGNFTITGLPSGRHKLHIDGHAANRAGRRYGVFEATVDLVADTANVLPFTVWMPELDTAHEVRVASPTTREVVLTNPKVPGLEVHIPAGTVIRDENGAVVRRLGITAIPPHRPPFPLPHLGVHAPVYFTVQPGGAYLWPRGARIIYPNHSRLPARQKVEFWSYEPGGRGWHVYGHGQVSPDRRQVEPAPGVGVYEFTGAMFNAGNLPPDVGPPPGGCSQAGDPVDCATGLFLHSETDLRLDDVLPIGLERTYRPGDPRSRAFGIGTTLTYDMFLWSAEQYRQVDLVLPDGGRVHYVRTSAGTGWSDAVFEHTGSPGEFYRSRISWGAAGGWLLTLRDGTVLEFPQYRPLAAVRDRFGNRITITRDGDGRITQVTSPSGRWISFADDTNGRITQARDNLGRTVRYAYDTAGRLTQVTDPTGGITAYTYDSAHRMLSVTTPAGIVKVRNTYDSHGRVATQTLADGGTWRFAYETGAGGRITRTVATDPRGVQRSTTFNAAGYATVETRAAGTPVGRSVTLSRDAANRVIGVVDPLNRRTGYTYDDRGNLTSVTRLAGTSGQVTWRFSYEPRFGQITSVVDPLGRATALAYDDRGALSSVTDAAGDRTTFRSDAAGRPTEVTDPVNATTRLTYRAGLLATVTDPLGRTGGQWVDPGGRPVFVTDAVGAVQTRTYDPLDRIVQVTDAHGGVSRMAYDPGGNLVSLTGPRGGVTRWSYDAKGRVASRTDPLAKTERYTYDRGDNLTGYTDRRGVTSTVTFDALDRPTAVAHGGSGVDTYAYDAGDRLLQVSTAPATAAGVISRAYDPLDRLVTEQTPQGRVDYSYDSADRRTGMTVQGQPAVGYAYDAADRLTSVTRGGAAVRLGWDTAGRRTSVSLPDGVTTSYAYDTTGQATAVDYRRGTATLGGITYRYDTAGRRQGVDGSLTQVDLPPAVTGATYDAADRLTRWGNAALAYDSNGNLTSDGTRNYRWNDRDQLTAVGNAAFRYDQFGRRTSVTVGAVTSNYLYDGKNAVQEQTTARPTATLLGGLDLDDHFGRIEGNTATYHLTDALGSTVALTDANGIATRYSYEPYGATTTTGTPSTNRYQYTGRENDGTGLYYYRARYYSPAIGRFISEDPAGTGGSLYAYAAGEPISRADPTGMVWKEVALVSGAGFRVIREVARAEAMRLYQAGLHVATNSAKGARKLAKDVSTAAGGGGRACHREAHGTGANHYHGLDERGRHLPGGHVFYDTSLKGIFMSIVDVDGNGYLDERDWTELLNPFPFLIMPPAADSFNSPMEV